MRLQEILARLAAINADLQQRGNTMTEEQIAALETEVAQLIQERDSLQNGQERRSALLNRIAGGEGAVVRSFTNPNGQPGAPAAPSPVAGQEARSAGEDMYDTREYRAAFMNYVRRGTPIPAEFRADENTLTTDAAAVVPTTVMNRIVEKLENLGMILPLVTPSAIKAGVSIPTSSVKPVATWVAEGAGSDKQKKTTGTITFAYHKLRCAVSTSFEMDVMALSAFEAALIKNVSEAMVKAVEQAIVSGTGTGQPKGILAETPATGQAIDSVTPAYADLIAAEGALPQAYENGAVWCMTKKTFMLYYGLTDTQGQPIGRVNMGTSGKPERYLLGRPVICCDYLDAYAAALTAGKVFAFLFKFDDYVLNTNWAMSLKKYEDNETDDQVTKAIMLVDGKVTDKNSLVVIKKKAA